MSDSNWYGSSAEEQQPEVSSLWQQPSDPAQDPQQSYAQPSYGEPSYGQPSYDQPSYGQPSYGQPSYGQPSYGQPSTQQPSTQQPTQHQNGQHNGQHHGGHQHNGQHQNVQQQNGQQPNAPVYGQPYVQDPSAQAQVQYGDPSVPYVTNPYGQPTETGKRKWSGMAIAGLIAGLVVLIISFTGFVYIGVLPILLNVRGLMDVKRNHKKGKPLAIIGLVLTGLAIIIALISLAN